MNRKIGFVKISICAAFLALFAVPVFFTQAYKISAIKTNADDLANPQNCAACHQEKYDSWHQNNHSKTVKKAVSGNVQGDFERENRLEYDGVKVEMTHDGEGFYIKIGDENYKVRAIVGTKYIEQYVAEKNGELYSLPIAFNLTENRWIHLNDANFERKDVDFSRHLNNWKTDCAVCHRSGENNLPNGFDDFGISCSACHGNAAEHIESKTSLWAKIGFKTENKIINPNNLSSDGAMMICAQCHARNLNDTLPLTQIAADQSFDKLISAHQQTVVNSEKYWSNGANKFSGNEYQEIVRSVCYAQSKSGGRGIEGEKINCANCHSPHEKPSEKSGELVAGKSYNQSCIQCHSQFSDAAAITEHTKHSINSEASNCVSCHQPETVYSRMRFNRTHEISVPNPILTIEKQIPNACNLCHTDKSVNWAISSSKKLWSERFRDAENSPDKQFDQPEGIRALSSDDAFQRALAVDSIRKHSDIIWSAPFLFEAFQHEQNPLVKQLLADTLKLSVSN